MLPGSFWVTNPLEISVRFGSQIYHCNSSLPLSLYFGAEASVRVGAKVTPSSVQVFPRRFRLFPELASSWGWKMFQAAFGLSWNWLILVERGILSGCRAALLGSWCCLVPRKCFLVSRAGSERLIEEGALMRQSWDEMLHSGSGFPLPVGCKPSGSELVPPRG